MTARSADQVEIGEQARFTISGTLDPLTEIFLVSVSGGATRGSGTFIQPDAAPGDGGFAEIRFALECNVPFNLTLTSTNGGLRREVAVAGGGDGEILDYDLVLTGEKLPQREGTTKNAIGEIRLIDDRFDCLAAESLLILRLDLADGGERRLLAAGSYVDDLRISVEPVR